MENITFIGLGKMGSAMATRILAAGMPLTVYNRNQDKMRPLVEKGAKAATSIKAAVTEADIILSCLFDDAALKTVALGADGILEHMKPSATHVGLATILPKTAEQMAKAHHERHTFYVSGAVLGIPKVALAGGLTAFCAGDAGAVEQCEPVLRSFAAKVINLGDKANAPLIMKVCMNYSLVTTIQLVSELYTFAEKNGLEVDKVQNAMHDVFAHPAFKLYIDKVRERDFNNVNFTAENGMKDLRVFQEAFADVGVKPGLVDLAKGHLISAIANGLGAKDWCVFAEMVRQDAGIAMNKVD